MYSFHFDQDVWKIVKIKNWNFHPKDLGDPISNLFMGSRESYPSYLLYGNLLQILPRMAHP